MTTTTTSKPEKTFTVVADASGNLKITDEIIFELYGTPETRKKSRSFSWKGVSWSTLMVVRADGIGLFFGYSNKFKHKTVSPSVWFQYRLLSKDGKLLSMGPEINHDFSSSPRNQRLDRLDYGRFGMFPSSVLDDLRIPGSDNYCLRFILEVKDTTKKTTPSPKSVITMSKEDQKEQQNLTPIEIEIEGESENEIPSSDTFMIQSLIRPIPPAIPPTSPLAVSSTTQDSGPSNNYQVNTLNIFPKLMSSVFDLKHMSTMELTCVEVQVADFYEEVRKERRKRQNPSSSSSTEK